MSKNSYYNNGFVHDTANHNVHHRPPSSNYNNDHNSHISLPHMTIQGDVNIPAADYDFDEFSRPPAKQSQPPTKQPQYQLQQYQPAPPEYQHQISNASTKWEEDISSPTVPSEKRVRNRQHPFVYVRETLWKGAVKTIGPQKVKYIALALLFVVYNVFFGFAIHHSWDLEADYCRGVRFLFIMTVLAYTGILYFCFIKRFFKKQISKSMGLVKRPINKVYGYKYRGIGIAEWISYTVLTIGFIVFLVIDTENNRQRLMSLSGVVALLLFGFVFSKHPDKIIWRHVFWGLLLQVSFALIILRWDVGQDVFQCTGDKISAFFDFTTAGSGFVFSFLATGSVTFNNTATGLPSTLELGKVFAFSVLPVIVFFSFTISLLYYYGIMQWIVVKMGYLLQISIGTTAAESINAAANIFIGQTEAPLLIRPYLPLMTKSELHAVMTGGFATIAGAVMAAYINMGVKASNLLAASVMSAPGALGYSKLFYPESEESQTTPDKLKERNKIMSENGGHDSDDDPMKLGNESTALEAASNGAVNSIPLVANITVNLIAFMAAINFLDFVVTWFFSMVGWTDVSFVWLLSKVFTPLAYLLGVPWEDCETVGELIGFKTIINEFVAYSRMTEMKSQSKIGGRAELIATYALCGFSNISAIGIQIGGLGAMAPHRKKDLAEIAVRALIAGSATCFMTASIAGLLSD